MACYTSDIAILGHTICVHTWRITVPTSCEILLNNAAHVTDYILAEH